MPHRHSIANHIDEAVRGCAKSEKNERQRGRSEERHTARMGGSMRQRRNDDGSEGFQNEDYPIVGNLFLLLLFFVLSPGVLLTLPPGKGGFFMSCQTSYAAAFVHALLLVVLFNYI